ncbi:ACP dehydratase [Desulfurivibrio alkaliphilus]|uniref:Acyl carrier protein dehydratase n=1 Tax=Desulfurivibrio alkaliphilus (strain DSM 19089 / UNIQEM U267 / AHT2) TaxID=589865 RepID=D6Z2P2_DESAT|nr:ACP dehydratase [Desulfurivibrio alkaliphilus]ADH85817.1 acyl carrier protein dehydratase [Desulfurivibrio alkaliphilus AHT 2]
MSALTLPLPAVELVPQRPPMLLVDELLEWQPGRALARAVVPAAGIWVDADSGVSAEYWIELVAQAMAAANGYDARRAGVAPGGGMLVGVDAFRLLCSPRPGATVLVELEKTFEFGAVKIIRGWVRSVSCKDDRPGDVDLAEVEIKVWEGDMTEEGR